MAMDLATEPQFRLGALTIRPSTREVVFAGGRETIEPRVMEVLLVLAQAGGEVVSRDRLVETCWGGRAISDDAINRVISRIRRIAQLGEGKGFVLETIPKVGYRLQAADASGAPVSEAPAATPGPTPVSGMPRRGLAIVAFAVAVLLAAAAGVWVSKITRAPAPDASLTLAVLPFDDLGTGHSDAALATGLSREIRNTLSRVRGLRVVSDASSFAVAAESIAAPEIAKRLSADLLIDGSFTRQADPAKGDVIHLTAELVDGQSGVNLWTGSQSGPAADLDRVRQLMSAAIFEQLVARIGPKRLTVTSPPRRGNPEVYRLVLEAGELLQQAGRLRASPSRAEEALNLGDQAYVQVEQALEIDPNDPLALSMLGRMTINLSTHALRQTMTWLERQSRTADYLRRALATDPDNVLALAALGDHYRRNEWRWADAHAMLERALALDPNQSDTQLVYTYFLTTTGRCVDAVRHARSAIAIDPEFSWNTLGLPRALKCAGGDDEANALYLRQLAANPDKAFLAREIYLNAVERRDPGALRALPATVREASKGEPIQPQVEAMLERARLAANALEGDPAPYVARLEADVAEDMKLGEQGLPNGTGRFAPDMAWMHAIEFAMAGKPQRAIDMLEYAIANGSLYIPETLPHGAYEFSPEVRADRRYQAIWRDDPRLRELVRIRLEAVTSGQMQGTLADGRLVSPRADDLKASAKASR